MRECCRQRVRTARAWWWFWPPAVRAADSACVVVVPAAGSEGRGQRVRGMPGAGSEGRRQRVRRMPGAGSEGRGQRVRAIPGAGSEGRGQRVRGMPGAGSEGRGQRVRGMPGAGSEGRGQRVRRMPGAGSEGAAGMEGRRRRALLVLLALLSCRVEAEDIVVGCGGFVKSDVEINYSLIEIKLYTKQGTLKYQTDCAPNNGYFMIPLYDKGDFILKIEPPLGWSFEPTNVDLHVDGINDICTKGEDINFVFTGFSVSGKVLSKGQTLGPAGVHVNLRKVGRDVDQTSLTQTGGKYVFTKVLPGDYEIFASHPTWTLQKASTSVQVINSNANTVDSLVVAGYEVLGSVRSDGEPMKGVVFLLFSPSVAKQDISGCNSSPVEGFQTADEASSFLCSVLSGEDGAFVFPSLPSGEYTVVPFYRGERITFDVAPSRLDFSVAHNSLRIEPVFRVMGFSVTGRVLDGANGQGVRYATVVLSNQIKVTSKADGSFRLENMTAGTYTINTQKEHIFFEPVTVKIAPNTPQLADIVATSFSVCGHVAVKRFPEGLKQIIKYKLAMVAQSKDKASPILTETDSRGLFCFQARAGTYVIQVMVSENEAKAGLALKPKFQTITVKNAPIMDLSFTQFMASVTGKVVCLDSCGNLAVTLQHLSRHSDKQSVQLSAGVDSVLFTFNDILPGKYKVNIVHEEWCWKNRSFELEVVDQDVAGIEFKQTGYMLRCSLSHAITLEFYQDGSGPENVGVYNLTKGVNRFCLSKPGVYKVTPRSCHQFEHEYYIYDTAAPTILTLTAIRHRALGAIVTDKLMDVTVTIRSSIDSEPALVLGPLKSLQEQRQEQQLAEIEARRLEREKKGQQVEREPPAQEIVEELEGPFVYEFSYWARAGEKITVTPSSKELLFYPPSVEALITGDTCPGRLIEIQGKAGLFLEGQIHPTLEGVEIIIIEKTSKPLITVFTNEEGSYRVGPLHRDQEYSVTAQKEGFVLTALEGTLGDFKAFALAGVTFEIKTEDDQPLAGVLLSLSGGQFRSNLLTQENGMLTFANLSPGQYYFKPMMKEFRFEPASQMIEIQEGQTLKIKITGYRTAYSCYGLVSSLNGEPEQGVSVEAVGQEDCSIYGEDTVTDEDGKFRLRGLLPSCVYHIQLKADGNDHIERALPQYRAVQVNSSDIDGVNILAFRQINQFDLSGNVITSPEHLSTLRVVLYKSENLDNPIQTVSLGQSLFFHFPPLLRDGENYVVVLESTLPKSLHEYILPQISFSATGYHKHITLMFNPSRKLPEQDVAQGSYIALPLTLLLLLAGYNHDKLIPLLMQLVNRLQGVRVLSQGGLDGVSQEEAKRQAKRLKTRRT